MEKKFEILEIKRKLPLNEKMRLLRERLTQQKNEADIKAKQEEDQKISNDIYSKALQISTDEKIPFVEALQRAQKEIESVK